VAKPGGMGEAVTKRYGGAPAKMGYQPSTAAMGKAVAEPMPPGTGKKPVEPVIGPIPVIIWGVSVTR
jgi:hypothetical protein